jgi:uncharacterized protein YidB (DUF937 family)
MQSAYLTARKIRNLTNPQDQLSILQGERDNLLNAGIDPNDIDEISQMISSGDTDSANRIMDEFISLGSQGGDNSSVNMREFALWQNMPEGQEKEAFGRMIGAVRGAATNPNLQNAPQGYQWVNPEDPSAGLAKIPGGPAEKMEVPSEGERKSATLLKRMEGSLSQLSNALSQDPSASKPGLLQSGLRAVGLEAAANTLTGEQRQQVENAQLDILDAALTLGTGAAYTKEQLEGYRKSYFPQIGDDPQTIQDKQARLANVIEAGRIAAGRAAPQDGGSQEVAPPAVKQPISSRRIDSLAQKLGISREEAMRRLQAKGIQVQ